MIENRLLQYFLVIAREQNMTKAAASLHISQPALSKQMALLEEQLGVKLFKRTNKNTTLTDDGAAFRVRAQEMMDMMNKLESEFSKTSGDISGDIWLGCGETYVMEEISKIFKEIQNEHPGIHFHIFSGNAESVLDRLDKGMLDFGLLLGASPQEKYDYRYLKYQDTFGILMPSDHPLAEKDYLTVEDIRPYPLIVSAQYPGSSKKTGDIVKEIYSLNVAGTYNLMTNATFLVEQGLGIALCLDKLINTNGRNLTLRSLVPQIELDTSIVTKKYAVLTKAARLFLEKCERLAK